MRKSILYILFFFNGFFTFGQESKVLTFSEYLGYIKKYHPIVKQANLLINESEAKLMKARGAFDPKLEVEYENKRLQQTEYFNRLNAAFKMPTWYGIEVKGNYEDNSGTYLNPEANVPGSGLYSMGISVPFAKGLLMNERMATLKQAKLYQQQAVADNQLLVNEILYSASLVYFEWLKRYREKEVYEEFLSNAALRFQGIKRSFEAGEKPAIDTTEARIALNNRKLNLEKANLNYIKSTLALSNYLWIDDVPVEIQDSILPDAKLISHIEEALQIADYVLKSDISNHPKLLSLDFKYRGLEVERTLQKNNLLPQIDLRYNFLTATPDVLNTLTPNNYKVGLSVNFPLFVRKERANLRLTNYNLQAIDLENQAIELTLKNKLNTVQQEIISYENQISIANAIVSDFTILLKGEERKFNIGESSLFLINSRESKLIENKLKVIQLENLLLNSKGKLFNVLGI